MLNIFKLELPFSEQLFLWVYNGMKSQIRYGYSGVVGITVYIKPSSFLRIHIPTIWGAGVKLHNDCGQGNRYIIANGDPSRLWNFT